MKIFFNFNNADAKYAVLVEMAFITNTYDANLLREKYDDFAKSIARGISDIYS